MIVEDLAKAFWMLNGEELGAVSVIRDGMISMTDGRVYFVDDLVKLYNKTYPSNFDELETCSEDELPF